jgi:hypothetical protein
MMNRLTNEEDLLEVDKYLIERDKKALDWLNTIISGFGDDNSKKLSFLMMFAATGASQMADAFGLPDPLKYLEFCDVHGTTDECLQNPTYLVPLNEDVQYQRMIKSYEEPQEESRIITLA